MLYTAIALLLLNNTFMAGVHSIFMIGESIGDFLKNVYSLGINSKIVQVYLGGGQAAVA